jgi:hypothetical protein
VLDNGLETVKAMEAILETHFPHGAHALSKVAQEFEAALVAQQWEGSNPVLASAIPATRDMVSGCVAHLEIWSHFIQLHVPVMEDGNNFGVTVQMTIAKALNDLSDEWKKMLGTLVSYYSTRADAVDKLGLAKTSSTSTISTSESDSTGGKDGDAHTTSKNASTEEKTSTPASKPEYHRLQHVVAMDVQMYAELQANIYTVRNGYLTILDQMDKNKDKLAAPKGTSSSSHSMY